MASLGQELKEAREARNISIEEIASATKIVPRYLEALEADRLEIMPGGFFIKGIIRTYARSIGLNEEEVLAKYRAAGIVGEPERKRLSPLKSEPPPAGRAVPRLAPEQPAVKAIPEPPVPPIPKPAPEPPPPPLILMPEPDETPAPKAEPDPAKGLIIKPAPDAPGPSLLKRALETLLRKRIVPWVAGGAVLVLAIVFLVIPRLSRPPGQAQGKTVVPEPVVTQAVLPPQQKVEVEPPAVAEDVWKGVTIEISFQAETWIQVYADGALRVDGLFPPGATAKAQGNEKLLIHVGNAGGFTFLLNGKPAKPLGRSGQVITDIKITPDNLKDFLQAETPGQPAG